MEIYKHLIARAINQRVNKIRQSQRDKKLIFKYLRV